MNKVNVVPVQILEDHVLLGEFNYIPIIMHSAITLLAKDDFEFSKIPAFYRLDNEHNLFFINKCHWLFKRYEELYRESIRRSLKVDDIGFINRTKNFYKMLRNTEL